MIDRFIEKMITLLNQNGVINESEIELYYFGFNRLFLFCINITTTIAIGIACNMVWQSILFSLSYIPLRRYAGGYHAKSSKQCFWWSVLLILISLQLIRNIHELHGVVIFLALLSVFIIFKKAPVESENKPLRNAEKNAFKKKTRRILISEIVIVMVFSIVYIEAAICLVVAILCVAFMLILKSH